MNPSPAFYSISNYFQRRDAQEVFRQFKYLLNWRYDLRESYLDVGCGAGDVSNDIILKEIPECFEMFVGVDISEKMIRHAKRRYERDNILFDTLNIEADPEDIIDFLKKFPKKFDHVVSFSCFDWIRDQRKGLHNIYEVMKQDADCLLVFLVGSPIFKIYEKMATYDRWRPFMPCVDTFFGIDEYATNPEKAMNNHLESIGFISHTVRVLEKRMCYVGYDTIKRNLTVVNPVWPMLTIPEQDEYFEQFLRVAANMNVYKEREDETRSRFEGDYQLLVTHMVK